MIHGQPTSYPDIFAMDVARYGPWASRAYTLQKSQENYRRRFRWVCTCQLDGPAMFTAAPFRAAWAHRRRFSFG